MISTLVGKGRARNELKRNPLSGIRIKDGNIYFSHQENCIIKKFSINEILTKPLGERQVDIIALPPEVESISYIETGDNQLFGPRLLGIDDKSYRYFIYAQDSISYLEELNEKYKASKNVTNKHLSQAFRESGTFESYKNKVVTGNQGLILQIVDLEKRIIENERFYNKIEVNEKVILKRNEYSITNIRCNEKYIYCETIKYD